MHTLQIALLLAAVITGVISGWKLTVINDLYIMGVEPYTSTKWVAAFAMVACAASTVWSVFLMIPV